MFYQDIHLVHLHHIAYVLHTEDLLFLLFNTRTFSICSRFLILNALATVRTTLLDS